MKFANKWGYLIGWTINVFFKFEKSILRMCSAAAELVVSIVQSFVSGLGQGLESEDIVKNSSKITFADIVSICVEFCAFCVWFMTGIAIYCFFPSAFSLFGEIGPFGVTGPYLEILRTMLALFAFVVFSMIELITICWFF